MDPEEFQRMLDGAAPMVEGAVEAITPEEPAAQAQVEPSGAVTPPVEDTGMPEGMTQNEQGQWVPAPERGLGDPSGLDAVFGGALKSVFETKDFFFGTTPEDELSDFRKNTEDLVDKRKAESMVDGFAAGISQFAVGMIGLGKIKLLSQLGATGKAAKVGVEAGKAAAVGAISFDPMEERLSNLIQSTSLANPINGWLAADPEDSAAEGRVKAALESIGLDAAILGITMGSLKAFKYMRNGDDVNADKALTQMQAEAQARVDLEVTPKPVPDAEPVGFTPAKPSDKLEEIPATTITEDPNALKVEVATDGASAVKPEDAINVSKAEPVIKVDVEDTEAILKGMQSDADAIAKHGGWYQALENGHTFGQGEGVPYAKFSSDGDVDDFIARIADTFEDQLNRVKGGDVLSDSKVRAGLMERLRSYGEDPSKLIGTLQAAGADARKAVSNVEAGFVVSQKMFMDSHALAQRINMGDYTQFGTREAAISELKSRFSLAASVYGASRSMVTNAARTVRQQRFRVDPNLMNKLDELDGESFLKYMQAADGDPRALRKLAQNPSMMTRIVDQAQFMYINNLLSGPVTHAVNTISNMGMLAMRPMERMIGSAVGAARGDAAQQQIFKSSMRQYGYMATSFRESWSNSVEALLRNDSVLTPSHTELYNRQSTAPVLQRGQGYKPLTSLNNLMYNSLLTANTAISAPSTRLLGMMDEVVKQTSYRSFVQANSHVEAIAKAAEQGLTGKAQRDYVKQYVDDAVGNAFDAKGRATNPSALREAQITTFQNELAEGSLGRNVQQFVSNTPAAKFVLPFVKTPTNILRYGWKLTPGLNLLQTEFRNALTGKMGAEAKAQAIGQFSMGTLFMGYAASMVADGSVTGGGPSDPKARAQLLATGWKPYAKVRVDPDTGDKTFISFGRFDPVAIPMGIIADLQDFMVALDQDEENREVGNAIGALSLALAKQFTSKTYLTGMKVFVDALNDPDRNLGKVAADMGSNFVPFSSGLRQTNPDPYLREARDLVDKVKATIPGLSETVPAKYDAWGEPIRVRRGLWATVEDNFVDAEVQRLAIEGGSTVVTPNPMQNSVDLRDLTMVDGRNAYEVYQQLSGKPSPKAKPLKSIIHKVMQGKAYQLAPDGDVMTKGTKLWLLHNVTSKYRNSAMKQLKRDANVREAFTKETLKVRDAYAAGRAKATVNNNSMGKLGEAFGQDLDALN